jgi:hypothetical protein
MDSCAKKVASPAAPPSPTPSPPPMDNVPLNTRGSFLLLWGEDGDPGEDLGTSLGDPGGELGGESSNSVALTNVLD